MKTLRIGFIGAGFIARLHIRAITMVRGWELTGIYSLDGADECSQYARDKRVGPCTIYPDIAELCNHSDVVAIFAPNYARVEIMDKIVEAVNAGAELKGLICEKPLARTVAEARRMIELAKKTKLPTAYFENQIYMKSIKSALAQLAPQVDTMGPVVLARSAQEHAGPHEPWFWDPTLQGGGVLCDMACHSIAVSWYALTPLGKSVSFLRPTTVNADTCLLKWHLPKYRKMLIDRMGIDYNKVPAEDFCTGIITFQNPDTDQIVKAQFTNSWMYDKQGLRLCMDGLGPGYAFEMNSLKAPLEVFVSDDAAEAVADAETAVEKATASRGLIPMHANIEDLYGYVDEWADAFEAFQAGNDAMLNWDYGFEITMLCQAAYLSAEKQCTIDLTDPATKKILESYTPRIAQGKGAEVLFR